jgi:PAS domain S-box-containing protein
VSGGLEEVVCAVIPSSRSIQNAGAADGSAPLASPTSDAESLFAPRSAMTHRCTQMFRALPDGVLFTDVEGRVLDANPVALQILGRSLEQVRDRRVADLDLRATRDDGSPLSAGDLPWSRALAGQPTPENQLLAVFNPLAQQYRWVRVTVRLLAGGNEHSSSSEWCLLLRDVTDERAADAAAREGDLLFRALADCMPQMVWMTAADGAVEYFNQHWFDYTATTRATAMGDAWTQLLHPDDQARAAETWREAVRTGKLYETEYRLRRGRDTEYRWFLSRAVPLRDRQGRILKWVGTSTDIHETKAAEATLRHAKDELERASRAKDEFLATLSHELRTPLNAILGWAQLIQMGVIDEAERAEVLDRIEQSARTQTKLIEDILDMSRIISGKLRIASTLLDVARVTCDAARAMEEIAAERGVTIDCRSDCDAPLNVRGDAARLQQVVCNLLDNAIKFSSPGQAVMVRILRARTTVRIVVSDRGCGIVPTFLPHVFERFRQADSSSTRPSGGLGLGLTIVRHLVELHGGKVSVSSEGIGHGATFTVDLPLAASKPVVPRAPAPRAGALPRDLLKGVDVLVVDDERIARDLVAAVLSRHGATVRTSSGADEARQALQHHKPDVLVSDIAMPEIDGHALVSGLRAIPDRTLATLPAIALTAYASIDDRHRALEAGFDYHLTKPVEPPELIRTVAEAARRGRTALPS